MADPNAGSVRLYLLALDVIKAFKKVVEDGWVDAEGFDEVFDAIAVFDVAQIDSSGTGS